MRRAQLGEAAEASRAGKSRKPTPKNWLKATRRCRRRVSSRCLAGEQFILTISVNGYGKRSSSYEYRVTGRGGKGIVAMAVNPRNGELIASMPVLETDQIMLVTDGGQLIRCPVAGIRIIGRSAQGVIVFNTADSEKVVSVERIGEVENGEVENGEGENGEGENGEGENGEGENGEGENGEGDSDGASEGANGDE